MWHLMDRVGHLAGNRTNQSLQHLFKNVQLILLSGFFFYLLSDGCLKSGRNAPRRWL